MLRENKSIIAKVVIFAAVLIFGAYALRSSRTGNDSPMYEYDNDYTAQPQYDDPEYTRQPISTTNFICQCQPQNQQPARVLAPQRLYQDPVQIEALHIYSSATLLLESDGSLWSWGWNHDGAVGDGTLTARSIPLKILDSVVSIIPGGNLALRADGSLWGWGPVRQPAFTIAQVPPTTPRHIMDDVVAFYSGVGRSFAIKADGSLWVWDDLIQAQRWGTEQFVPHENSIPAHLMDCVVSVSISENVAMAHRCDASLWVITSDPPVHMMDDVVSFYIAEIMGAQLRETFVIQSDNSLWAIDPIRRHLPPRHLLDDVAAVRRTDDSAFFIKHDGSLWAMGLNVWGQLGDGTTVFRNAPVWIMESVSYIYPPRSWGNDTFAILADGSLWAWGTPPNSTSDIARTSPEHIMDDVASVYQTWSNIFALKTDGSLWYWSPAAIWWFEDNMLIDSYMPLHVMDGISKVYLTDWALIAIGTDGGLWTWLTIDIWQHRQHFFTDGHTVYMHAPKRQLDDVISIYSRHNNIFAIQADGSLWALWASPDGLINTSGVRQENLCHVNISNGFSYALGNTTVPILEDMQKIPPPHENTFSPPLLISAFWSYFFVDTDGELWTWGGNWRSRFNTEYVMDYTPVHLMDSVIYARTSGHTVYAVQENGDLLAWRSWLEEPPVNIMNQVTSLSGEGSVFAVREDNSLWGWGSNFVNQLADDSLEGYVEYPVQIMEEVTAVHMSGSTVFAHRLDGSLWSWGRNDRGVLGTTRYEMFYLQDAPPSLSSYIHTPGSIHNPAQVIGDVAVFRLQEHSAFAIQENGYLWAWGDNSGGQLGDGTRVDRLAPVKIMCGAVAVHTTTASTFAIRADGSLWAWGWNAQGQLGDGTAISRLTPVHIMNNVRDMYLAPGASFAVLDDGSLWAWGSRFGHRPVRIMDETCTVYTRPQAPLIHYIRDASGELWVLDYYSITPEFVMDSVSEVFFTQDEVFAVRENGELWVWGQSRYGVFVSRDYAARVIFDR